MILWLHGFYPQASTWSKQYDAAATANIPSMEKLKNWLHSNIPQDTFKTGLVIVFFLSSNHRKGEVRR